MQRLKAALRPFSAGAADLFALRHARALIGTRLSPQKIDVGNGTLSPTAVLHGPIPLIAGGAESYAALRGTVLLSRDLARAAPLLAVFALPIVGYVVPIAVFLAGPNILPRTFHAQMDANKRSVNTLSTLVAVAEARRLGLRSSGGDNAVSVKEKGTQSSTSQQIGLGVDLSSKTAVADALAYPEPQRHAAEKLYSLVEACRSSKHRYRHSRLEWAVKNDFMSSAMPLRDLSRAHLHALATFWALPVSALPVALAPPALLRRALHAHASELIEDDIVLHAEKCPALSDCRMESDTWSTVDGASADVGASATLAAAVSARGLTLPGSELLVSTLNITESRDIDHRLRSSIRCWLKVVSGLAADASLAECESLVLHLGPLLSVAAAAKS